MWKVNGDLKLPKFGSAVSSTKTSAMVITHVASLAKVGKIRNSVARHGFSSLGHTMSRLQFTTQSQSPIKLIEELPQRAVYHPGLVPEGQNLKAVFFVVFDTP